MADKIEGNGGELQTIQFYVNTAGCDIPAVFLRLNL